MENDPSRDDGGTADPRSATGESARALADIAAAPETPPGAAEIFGVALPAAERYAGWLAGAGKIRGLMGPREWPRLWDRHILNCAAVGDAIGEEEHVVDIGSGAGLPGIPLALSRPDVTVALVEPLLRRTTFLDEVVADLQLDVAVVRGRAEEKAVIAALGGADVVTSRAVAPLAKLAGWSAPLLRSGGRMVALKGESAAEEVERDRSALSRLGFVDIEVATVRTPDAEPTHLVVATATREGGKRPKKSGSRRR